MGRRYDDVLTGGAWFADGGTARSLLQTFFAFFVDNSKKSCVDVYIFLTLRK